MHGTNFLQDIAIVLLVAGLVTIIFHRLRQPVVLGYILAGLIIGPHTPPFPLIKDKHTIDLLAELGVILLMFGLGLHFSLKDLARVGATAVVAASLEIFTLLIVGYGIGKMFGWSDMDSLFLGAIISISSTMIVIKALDELKLAKEKFAKLIFGILIVEDILAIAMLVLLAGVARTGEIGMGTLLETVGKMGIFLTTVFVVGLIVVPRLLRYVDRAKSSEMLLVTVLGLCFGGALLAAKMGYSVALGAFVMGAVMAESRERGKIELLTQPVRDMFSAVFFVAIGMLIQPAMLIQYALPIIVITFAVVVGKIITCAVGTFVTGHSPQTAMRVGTGKAQIGEFSFIIATLGLSLEVISPFLYPIAVTVSAITTLLTPYLIKNSDWLFAVLLRIAPAGIQRYMSSYSAWFSQQPEYKGTGPQLNKTIKAMLRRWTIMTSINMALVTGIFIGAKFIARWGESRIPEMPEWAGGVRGVVWFMAVVLAIPLLIVTVQKLRAGSLLLAEIWSAQPRTAALNSYAQATVGHTIFVIGVILIALWLTILSITVLPPWPVAVVLLVLLGLLGAWRWKAFARLYSKAQSALEKTLTEPSLLMSYNPYHDEHQPMPSALKDAVIEPIEITATSPAANRLIREIELRSISGVSAVAIERNDGTIINPGPDEEILPGDKILLLGSRSQIEAGRRILV